MTEAYAAVVGSPLPGGMRIGLRVGDGVLTAIDILPGGTPRRRPADPLAREAAGQLERYFDDPTVPFDLPLAPAGTAFQRRVWTAMSAIPAGETRGYGELAAALATAPRPVGGACRANPVPLVVPCHRVVAATGKGGFMGRRSGAVLAIKTWLLRHEGVRVD